MIWAHMAHDAVGQMDAFLTSDSATRRAPTGNIQVLRLPQVCRMTGLCRSSVYQMEAEKRFPSRIKIGARSVGWIESEVQSWLRRRSRMAEIKGDVSG
jgi:prophage regulatory protein